MAKRWFSHMGSGWWFAPSESAWWCMLGVTFLVLASLATCCAGANWPSVLGTFTAASVAAFMAWNQQQQHRFMEEQRLGQDRVMEYLAFLPVLTGVYGAKTNADREVEIHNIGNGPAMDLRATLYGLRMKEGTNDRTRQVFPAQIGSHLAAKGSLTAQVVVAQPSKPPGFLAPVDDVWIIHCRDLRARTYHLVSNSTGQGPAGDAPDRVWRWWKADQTPGWVTDVCSGCQEEREQSARDTA